jgi:hypothetical protein
MQVYDNSLWSNSVFQDIQPNCFAGLTKQKYHNKQVFEY